MKPSYTKNVKDWYAFQFHEGIREDSNESAVYRNLSLAPGEEQMPSKASVIRWHKTRYQEQTDRSQAEQTERSQAEKTERSLPAANGERRKEVRAALFLSIVSVVLALAAVRIGFKGNKGAQEVGESIVEAVGKLPAEIVIELAASGPTPDVNEPRLSRTSQIDEMVAMRADELGVPREALKLRISAYLTQQSSPTGRTDLEGAAIEFLRGHYSAASEIAGRVATVEREASLDKGRASDAIRLQSQALLALGSNEEAVAVLEDAIGYTVYSEHPVVWLQLQEDLGRALLIWAAHSSGEDIRMRTMGAKAAFTAAVAGRGQRNETEEWATSMNSLGVALYELARLENGPERESLLGEARDAHVAALKKRKRTHAPIPWATTRENLVTVQAELAKTQPVEVKVGLMRDQVAVYEDILSEISPKDMPYRWSRVQNNLAVLLKDLALATSGTESHRAFGEAKARLTSVLSVWTFNTFREGWGIAQSNLGVTLKEQATRSIGEERKWLLVQAMECHRLALIAYPRVTHSSDWARTRSNLGDCWVNLAAGATTGAKMRYLEEAINEYSNALEERSRAPMTVGWATSQNQLGRAHEELALLQEEDDRQEALIIALEAYDNAAAFYTPGYWPENWARTQWNRALVFGNQAPGRPTSARRLLLGMAAEAYGAAGRAWESLGMNSDAAESYSNMAVRLREQASVSESLEKLGLYALSIAAMRACLSVSDAPADAEFRRTRVQWMVTTRVQWSVNCLAEVLI